MRRRTVRCSKGTKTSLLNGLNSTKGKKYKRKGQLCDQSKYPLWQRTVRCLGSQLCSVRGLAEKEEKAPKRRKSWGEGGSQILKPDIIKTEKNDRRATKAQIEESDGHVYTAAPHKDDPSQTPPVSEEKQRHR